MLTRQEIFDRVASHLKRQKVQSKIGGLYRYHGEKGRKSPIGLFISDDDYTPEMEHYLHFSRLIASTLERSGVRREDFELLDRLEALHNNCPQSWGERIDEIARVYGLIDTRGFQMVRVRR